MEGSEVFIVGLYFNSMKCLININFYKNFSLVNSYYYFFDKK